MKSTLSEFISYFKKHGILTASHFAVNIGAGPGGESSNKNVMMMCESTSLPGMSLMTDELRISGDAIVTPYAAAYNSLPMTFLLDTNLISQQYFDEWIGSVYNATSRTFNYYADYVREIAIAVTDKAGKIRYQVVLHEAYPVTIQDKQLDSSNEEVLRISVDIRYRWYTVKTSSSSGEYEDASKLATIKSSMLSGAASKLLSTSSDVGFTYAEVTDVANTDWSIFDNSWLDAYDIPTSMNGFASQARAGVLEICANCSEGIAPICQIPTTRPLPGMISGPGASVGAGFVDSLSRTLNSFTGGILELSNDISDLGTIPGALSSSLLGMGSTLSAIDNISQIISGKSAFGGATASIVSAAARLQQVQSMAGLPGALNSAASGMVSTSQGFESLKQSARDLPGYTGGVGVSLSNMSALYNGIGEGLSSLTNKFR